MLEPTIPPPIIMTSADFNEIPPGDRRAGTVDYRRLASGGSICERHLQRPRLVRRRMQYQRARHPRPCFVAPPQVKETERQVVGRPELLTVGRQRVMEVVQRLRVAAALEQQRSQQKCHV